jgi:hypothetical protein
MITVTVELSPRTEYLLREKAAALGQSLETYLQALAEQAAVGNGAPAEKLAAAQPTTGQWEAEWRAWAVGHARLPYVADDSRESIYAGRGE